VAAGSHAGRILFVILPTPRAVNTSNLGHQTCHCPFFGTRLAGVDLFFVFDKAWDIGFASRRRSEYAKGLERNTGMGKTGVIGA
jgi:hypothetical protein